MTRRPMRLLVLVEVVCLAFRGFRCFAALSGVLRGHVACAAMVRAGILWDGCRGVARLGLGPVIVASKGVLGGPVGRLCSAVFRGAARWLLRLGWLRRFGLHSDMERRRA